MKSVRKNQPHRSGSGDARYRVLLPVIVLAFIAAGCATANQKGIVTATEGATSAGENGSDGDAGEGSGETDPDVDQVAAPTTVETTTTTTAPTTTTSAAPSTTVGEDGADGIPGAPIDLFAKDGDVLAVVGVADDDVLNVRGNPGTDQPILGTVGPADTDLVSTGRARLLTESIWYEISVDGVDGWVSASYVAFIGGTDDATAEFLADGGPVSADTMTDLGRAVAERFASTEPPSRIEQTVAPTVGDLGEVTYDVVGIGDDAVLGYRLKIFATVDEGGEPFTVRTIERTSLCSRGLTGELCS